MANNLLVSVIIPVFNVNQYLDEAINSVIHQTYKNLEIIIIDDGSTDGSGEKCDYYATFDNRICVIHQENKGLSSARNAGLDKASGQVISFLDPDDAFHPEMIRSLVHVMTRYKVDIAICGFTNKTTENCLLDETCKRANSESIVITDKREAFLRIVNGQINTAVWDKLYRKSVWENLRFPDGHVYEGTFIVFDLFNRIDSVAYLSDKLVMHRIRPGSICSTCSLNNTLDSLYASDKCFSFVKKHSPEIFPYLIVEELAQKRVRGIIGKYLNYIYNNQDDFWGKELIKRQLIDVVNDVGIFRCRVPIRICYYLALCFPKFSSLIYRFYKSIKR